VLEVDCREATLGVAWAADSLVWIIVRDGRGIGLTLASHALSEVALLIATSPAEAHGRFGSQASGILQLGCPISFAILPGP
jgi:hypothetical protein